MISYFCNTHVEYIYDTNMHVIITLPNCMTLAVMAGLECYFCNTRGKCIAQKCQPLAGCSDRMSREGPYIQYHVPFGRILHHTSAPERIERCGNPLPPRRHHLRNLLLGEISRNFHQ